MVVRFSDTQIKETRDTIGRLQPEYLVHLFDTTAGDYEAISTEDFRCEFIDGVLIVHSPAAFRHENCISFLLFLLRGVAAKNNCGFALTSNVVMQIGERRFCPDISFLSKEHADRIQDERVQGPMDLVIEVLSKSTRSYDLNEKRTCYREAGVPEIWLVDSDKRQFHVDWQDNPHSPSKDHYQSEILTEGRLKSRVVNGFWIDIEWLWADPLPNDYDCLGRILAEA